MQQSCIHDFGNVFSPVTFGGDGRSRTAVQTTHQEAFYTFSRPLVVGRGLPEDGLTEAYPLRLGRI